MIAECSVQVAFRLIFVSLTSGGEVRVLVVEDEVSLAKQLVTALRQAGYAVDHAR
jgi:hypothetical protein